jgi:uncharacterized membrane protein YqaE (UPF0057 family)
MVVGLSNNASDLEIKIDEDNFTLWDRFLYGGLGYSMITLPTNLFRIIATVLFPPLGVVMKYIVNDFPYIDFPNLVLHLDDVIYVLILTTFFYIPGLIYSLSLIKCDYGAAQTDAIVSGLQYT